MGSALVGCRVGMIDRAQREMRSGLRLAENVYSDLPDERVAERLYEAMNALQVKDEYHKAREAVDGLIQLLEAKG
ncbi:hypothetical protein CCB80_10185 [Armatimonadetes bacterium Uphvl-Ar1]|nr:hypothetical protein CCB80_10185 [Armatimonadetes bacterium Uphvl-Ar1]